MPIVPGEPWGRQEESRRRHSGPHPVSSPLRTDRPAGPDSDGVSRGRPVDTAEGQGSP